MVPSPDESARDAGMRAVRQKNCAACHQIDPGRVTFEADDGRAHTVAAELLPFEGESLPPAHDLEAAQAVAEEIDADEVVLRILRPEPELGLGVGDKLFVAADRLRAFEPPHGGDFVRTIADYYYYGIELLNPDAQGEDDRFLYVQCDPDGDWGVEDVDGVIRDHSEEPYDKVRWTFAPPVLWDEGAKVQRDWFYGFLNDVVPLRPQIRVRMPSFGFAPGEAESIASYFAHESARRWPAEYARRMRLALKQSAAEVAAGAGIGEAAVLAIENGSAPDIAASFAKLRAWGGAQGFSFRPPVDPEYETNTLRTQSYLARREAEEPGHLRIGDAIAREAVNCFQCHFELGKPPPADPIAWAPDMSRVHERLREDWVRDWLHDPGAVYPGTAMPANFLADPPQYQDRYPDSTNDEQLRVVLELLFNFDRFYLDSLKN
jgi:mono/diheme cytochrome c family protein